MYTLPVEDLKNIADRIQTRWPRNKKFFFTGATGFFGRWIVESIAFLEERQSTGSVYHVVSRKKQDELFEKIPVLQKKFFRLHQADLQAEFEIAEKFDFILHGAADVGLAKENPKSSSVSSDVLETLLNLRREEQAPFLYLSSGGVYQSPENSIETEAVQSHPANAYVDEKIQSEKTLLKYKNVRIARGFAFVGPYADPKMAVMDMIQRKVQKKPINVQAPTVKRSFMYPTDLVSALLRLLTREQTMFQIYNVGSPEAITLERLAHEIEALQQPTVSVKIAESESTKSLAGRFYYPNIDRLTAEFDNSFTVDLKTALKKTFDFEIKRQS